jgi:hypothetical protein
MTDLRTPRPDSPAMAAAFAAIDASVAKFAAQADDTNARIARWNEEAKRIRRAVLILKDHFFPGLTEETATTVLALNGIRVSSLGDVCLRHLIDDARRAAGQPEPR